MSGIVAFASWNATAHVLAVLLGGGSPTSGRWGDLGQTPR